MNFTEKVPGLFQIELTNYCNIDCSMCARSSGLKRPIGHMDINLFKKIVDQSREYKMPIHWMHHFGETMLYPKLAEALDYFKKFGYGPGSLSTNAVLLNEDKVNILLDYDREVLCCIDTMDPSAYKNIRNNKHFDSVKRNIGNFIEKRDKSNSDVKIAIQFLRTSYNMDENFTEMMDYFGKHDNVRYIEKRTDKHPDGNDITVAKQNDNFEVKRNCAKMHNELCILWSGEAVSCCWDAHGEQIIGDIAKNTIKEIWQGEKHKEQQKQLFNGVKGLLPLCDKCTGPVSDNLFGLREQINAMANIWIEKNKSIVLAPANKIMFDLYSETNLNKANIKYFCDKSTKNKIAPNNLEIKSYEELKNDLPDVVFIFSTAFSTEIYFQQKYLKDLGVEVVVLGEFL